MSQNEDLEKRPMVDMTMEILIPEKTGNFFWVFPKKANAWNAQLKKEADGVGFGIMQVKTLPTGCGGTGIFFPTSDREEDNRFGVIVSRECLGQIINVLQIAYDNYNT